MGGGSQGSVQQQGGRTRLAPALRRVALATLLVAPAAASAGGLDVGENGPVATGRGGAYAAAVDEPSAVYYNPAALATIDGFALTVNANIWLYDLTFQRDPFTFQQGNSDITVPFAEVSNSRNVFPAPMIFASHDFGLEDWGFGFGVYGPPSIGWSDFGSADLEELRDIAATDDNVRDWGHGYLMESSEMLLMYPSLAVAFDFGDLQLGLTLQLGYLGTTFVNAADGDGITDPNAVSIEAPEAYARTTLDVSGITFTGILGVRYQPFDALTLALSYRPRHEFSADGEINVEIPPALQALATVGDNAATLNLTLPDLIRFGARWAFINNGRAVADIELDFTYETWSLLEGFDIQLDANIDIDLLGETRQIPNVFIPKFYNDTMSLRLGSDIYLHDAFTLRAGVFMEGAAGDFFSEGSTSPGYANIDFAPFHRVGLSLGGTVEVGRWDIDFAYQHVLSAEYVESNGQVDILYPLWVCEDPQNQRDIDDCAELTREQAVHAVNNGSYDASYNLFSVGFTYNAP